MIVGSPKFRTFYVCNCTNGKGCRHAGWDRCNKSTSARVQHGSARIVTHCMLAEMKLHDGHADKIKSVNFSYLTTTRRW